MNMLPAFISDMCGIVMPRDHAPYACRREAARSPLSMTQDDEGIYTVTYQGHVLGWIGSMNVDRMEGKSYRAISASGAVYRCPSLRLAKNAIVAAAI